MITSIMTTRDSTERFSDRAGNYDAYRPGYPAAIVDYLEQTIALAKTTAIADIGSGTGIFAALFLDAGYAVKAVEPNTAMGLRAVKNLQQYKDFENIKGTAEQTGLHNHSVGLITVAQAFHWFNLTAVKEEFRRILQPGGYILLAWNILQTDTPFLKAYDAVKEKYAEKNVHPDHADPEIINQFFAPNPVITHQLSNIQLRDADGLTGLLSSSSKTPLPGEPRYKQMMDDIETLVDQYAESGLLKLEYKTKLYLAQL